MNTPKNQWNGNTRRGRGGRGGMVRGNGLYNDNPATPAFGTHRNSVPSQTSDPNADQPNMHRQAHGTIYQSSMREPDAIESRPSRTWFKDFPQQLIDPLTLLNDSNNWRAFMPVPGTAIRTQRNDQEASLIDLISQGQTGDSPPEQQQNLSSPKVIDHGEAEADQFQIEQQVLTQSSSTGIRPNSQGALDLTKGLDLSIASGSSRQGELPLCNFGGKHDHMDDECQDREYAAKKTEDITARIKANRKSRIQEQDFKAQIRTLPVKLDELQSSYAMNAISSYEEDGNIMLHNKEKVAELSDFAERYKLLGLSTVAQDKPKVNLESDNRRQPRWNQGAHTHDSGARKLNLEPRAPPDGSTPPRLGEDNSRKISTDQYKSESDDLMDMKESKNSRASIWLEKTPQKITAMIRDSPLEHDPGSASLRGPIQPQNWNPKSRLNPSALPFESPTPRSLQRVSHQIPLIAFPTSDTEVTHQGPSTQPPSQGPLPLSSTQQAPSTQAKPAAQTQAQPSGIHITLSPSQIRALYKTINTLSSNIGAANLKLVKALERLKKAESDNKAIELEIGRLAHSQSTNLDLTRQNIINLRNDVGVCETAIQQANKLGNKAMQCAREELAAAGLLADILPL